MTDISVSSSLHHKSPLDTLVRQSSRRVQHSPRLDPRLNVTSPGHGGSTLNHRPSSPLLHTRFRASASTATSSFMELQEEDDECNTSSSTGQELSWNRDDDSVYSGTADSPFFSPACDTPNFSHVVDAVSDGSPTLPPSPSPSPLAVPDQDRQSWASHNSGHTIQEDDIRQSMGTSRDTWRSSASGADPFSFKQYESPRTEVPRVVISSPISSMSNSSYYVPPLQEQWPEPPGYSPIQAAPRATQYSVSNFSRPIRHLTTHDEQSKLEVLERNRSTRGLPPPRLEHDEHSHEGRTSPSFVNQPQDYSDRIPSPAAAHSYSDSPYSDSNTPAVSRSVSTDAAPSNSGLSVSPNTPHSFSWNAMQGPLTERIRLPNQPPSPRPISRASVYSAYSFYQLNDGSRTPSPSSPQFPSQNPLNPQPPPISNTNTRHSPPPASPSRASPSRISPSRASPSPLPTPDEYLRLGIQHHEANRLSESAMCFERSATVDGGCGVGMLMWGLSLRHAWGTRKDEKSGFRWLRRAAEAAVGDLEAARQGQDQPGVQVCDVDFVSC